MPRTRQSSRQASSGQGSSSQGSSLQRLSPQGSSPQGSTRGSTHPRHARSSRAGLTLSVSLVEHLLREAGHTSRLSETAPIFLTAILEFLVHRVLELTTNEAQRRGAEMFITPELLDFAVYNNTALSELFQFTTISHVPLPEPGRRRSTRRRRQ